MMKKIKVLFLCMIMLLCIGACSKNENAIEGSSKIEEGLPNEPQTKKDGSKYRIAYVDYDDYLPACQQLYYILEGLKKTGWITYDELPFTSTNSSSKEMIEAVSKMDLGKYIEFDTSACYYLGYDGEEVIKESLVKHTEVDKDIDLVITFGTSAGVFVKSLNLSVPMMDFSATDPVMSGIIDSSTEGSGNPNVWAQVEPSMPLRQLKYYHSILPFEKLGIVVYGDETISGLPDCQKAAEEVGFDIIKYNIAETSRATEEELNQYYGVVEENFKKLVEDGVDAFFLTVDVINDMERLNLLDIFTEAQIPVFVMDDENNVKNGALMIIATYDFENVGYFIADAIGKVLSGAVAGELPCVYVSSPYICLNYDTAKKIGYVPDFKFLVSCDKVYH